MTDITHLPLELLQTFVKIVEREGDASAAAEALEISQPSISKRLSALRRLVSGDDERSWLMLKGKRWLLTPDGERVIGTVADLVRRYEQVERFVAEEQKGTSTVSIACGQTAASGFVRVAIEKLLKSHPDCRVRLSTPRGRDRITGVAGGQFDMAIVTDSEAVIRDIAGIDLYIEPLQTDRFVIVGNPSPKAAWSKAWDALPVRRPIKAQELIHFPFILPEPDANRRQQFDAWFTQANKRTPNVILEVGGWQPLLQFAHSGLGVGFTTEQAVASTSTKTNLATRYLDEEDFPSDQIRFIARKPQGRDSPDFGTLAEELHQTLLMETQG